MTKRTALIILLLICIGILCSCGSSGTVPMPKSMIHLPDIPESIAPEASLPAHNAGASDEQLIPFCVSHQYSEWTSLQTSPGGPWMETRICMICGNTESRIVQDPEPTTPERNPLGSAAKLTGKTVIVSIFANDSTTHWDFSLKADKDIVNTMHRHLGNATKWITKQCKRYDVTAEFVYDWKKNPDLYFTYDFGQTKLVRDDGSEYYTQEDYIEANINTQALLEKYDAENIIYIFYFNTPKDNTVNSWTISDQSGCYTEIINVFVRDDYSGGFYIMPASSFAHEMLHCYGAHDLYYASISIPQKFVDHMEKTRSKDIMYTVGLGGSITQKFTELDAYYVGLTDSCDLVETWGLAPSSHLPPS